jgi:hypothetical protein
LGVEILRLCVLARLLGLHDRHLLSVWRCLRGVRWGLPLVVRRVHVIVRIRLWVRILRSILVHLHVRVRSILSCLSLLCCERLLLLLSTLLGHAFEALLFLHAGGRRAT